MGSHHRRRHRHRKHSDVEESDSSSSSDSDSDEKREEKRHRKHRKHRKHRHKQHSSEKKNSSSPPINNRDREHDDASREVKSVSSIHGDMKTTTQMVHEDKEPSSTLPAILPIEERVVEILTAFPDKAQGFYDLFRMLDLSFRVNVDAILDGRLRFLLRKALLEANCEDRTDPIEKRPYLRLQENATPLCERWARLFPPDLFVANSEISAMTLRTQDDADSIRLPPASLLAKPLRESSRAASTKSQIEEYNRLFRPKSLMDMHQEKRANVQEITFSETPSGTFKERKEKRDREKETSKKISSQKEDEPWVPWNYSEVMEKGVRRLDKNSRETLVANMGRFAERFQGGHFESSFS